MKNSYVSISDQLGGAEQLIFHLSKKNIAHTEVCFFKSKSSNVWEQAGINTYYCDGDFIRFIRFFIGTKFQFVFSTHLMINAFLGSLRFIGLLKTEKLVCRESTSIFDRYKGAKLFKYKMAYWLGYRRIDLLITQSDLMKNKLTKNISYLTNRTTIKTIPNLFVLPEDDVINEKIDINANSIVAAGRLIPEKGFDILIEGFSKLIKRHPEIHLIILGEGNERKKLEQQINQLQLQEKIELAGFVNNVYPYFKKARMCVVSSRVEGFPNVLLQMMSQNTKVVSTLCAGGIDKIEGIYISKANDVSDLYTSMNNCLLDTTDRDIRKLFDKELNKRSIDNFIYKNIQN